MGQSKISRASLSRAPLYYKYLKSLPESIVNISSSAIAKALSLGEVQVRKDLACLCGSGKPKIGYERRALEESLESYFHNDNGETIIVGAGKLGIALLSYKGFGEYGLNILAAFDHNPKKIYGYNNENVYPTSKMKAFCKKNNVKIGIITVPASAAQEVFEELYACGIKLIMCFAPVKLKVPDDVVVQYEDVALSLAHLKQSSIEQ